MDGGGQLTAVLVPAGTEAADAAVLTPPVAGAGGPPPHAAEPEPAQALAAAAVRPSEPAVRAAETTAPAASWQT